MGGRGSASKSRFSGAYRTATSSQLMIAESQIMTYLRREEDSAVRSADKRHADIHLNQLKDLHDEYAEIQREHRRRGESYGSWYEQGFEDAVDKLEISKNGTLRSGNGVASLYSQIDIAEYAINKEISSKNPMGSTKTLRDQIKRLEGFKKELKDRFG